MIYTKRLSIEEIKQEIREYDWYYNHCIHLIIKGKKEVWDGAEMIIFATADRKVKYWCQMTARGWVMTYKTVADRGAWTKLKAR